MAQQPGYQQKLQAGSQFPSISVTDLHGQKHELGTPAEGMDWQLIVVYRGKHCPICTAFLNELDDYKERLLDIGVDVIAVSADSKAQLEAHLEDLDLDFTLGYGLTEDDMYAMGAYVSNPRSPEETDHAFAEPATFVINGERQVHIADYSNAPFSRPDIKRLVEGLQFIRDPDNNYPIRGTHTK